MSKPKPAGRMDLVDQAVHSLALQALSERLESKGTLTASHMVDIRRFGVGFAEGTPLPGSTDHAAWSKRVKAHVRKCWDVLGMWPDVDTKIR